MHELKIIKNYFELFLSVFTPNEYLCVTQSVKLSSTDDRIITKVTGIHLQGKTNEDVDGFLTTFKTFKFFPQNLQETFKKATIICVAYAELPSITKDDLRQFGMQLAKLELHGNDLQVINADLFEFNQNLKDIDLSFNYIKVVGRGAFDGLNLLSDLYFFENPCYSGDAHKPRDLKKLINKIEKHCKNKMISVQL